MSFTQNQKRALDYASQVDVPLAIAHFPAPIGADTIASLAVRGLLDVKVTLTPRGREIVQQRRLAEQRAKTREQMRSRLKQPTQAQKMGAR